MTTFERLAEKNNLNNKLKIEELKKQLADTDYIAIKYSEGWLTSEEYEPTKILRESLRVQIRELEN